MGQKLRLSNTLFILKHSFPLLSGTGITCPCDKLALFPVVAVLTNVASYFAVILSGLCNDDIANLLVIVSNDNSGSIAPIYILLFHLSQ